MKCVFVHNEKVKEDEYGNLYTGGAYNDDIWKRYLAFSPQLTVLLKKEKKIYSCDYAQSRFNRFYNEQLTFIPLRDPYRSIGEFMSPKSRHEIKNTVAEAVKQSDAVIVRSVASLACRTAIKCAVRYRKPYIIEVTGIAWRSLWYHDLKGKILAPVVEFWNHYYISRAPYVLYVTRKVLQMHYESSGMKVGISDVEIPDMDDKWLERRITKIYEKKEKIVLGTIGNLNVKLKNQKLVIQALGKLKKEGYYFEYQLVGYGEKEELEKIAEKNGVAENVKFLGGIPHEHIFQWLDDIDIYIQPSKQEGMPRALIEAASRGCPLLGSNIGGITELVDAKRCFRPNDVCKLVDELKSLYSTDELEKEARRSFEAAKFYQKSNLDDLRCEFWDFFKKENHLM